jgi:hypothetical protein
VADTPFGASIYDPFQRAVASSNVAINAADHGVTAASDDIGPALKDIRDRFDSQGGTIIFPTGQALRCKEPIEIKRGLIDIGGTMQFGQAILFDLTTYAGPLPKYAFILGDAINDPDANTSYDFNTLRNMRIDVTGGEGGILLKRANISKLLDLSITGTGSSYGIRAIASDDSVIISRCLVGYGGVASQPSIGVSIEDGSHQCSITESSIHGLSEAIRTFNSVGLRILNNDNIAASAQTPGVFKTIRIMVDQPVPAWLTWLPGNAAFGIRIKDNIFEPGDLAPLGTTTLYDVYLGDGVPSVHAIMDVECEGNTHLGTAYATRVAYVIDHGDGVYVRPGQFYGVLDRLVHVKAPSVNHVVEARRLATYNTGGLVAGNFILDESAPGAGLVIDDSLGSGFRQFSGSFVMVNGSPIYFRNVGDSDSFILNNTSSSPRWQTLPTYADNAAAVAAGLSIGSQYKTATGELRIVV